MADILSIFGILLITGLAFPAFLTAVWLTLPKPVDRARQRIAQTPRRCFFMGLLTLLIIGTPTAALLSAPSAPTQFAGWSLVVLLLATATIGGAGMAAQLGEAMKARSNNRMGALASFLTGALSLELAAVFPIIGWVTVLPIALITGVGATTFALLRWRPRAARAAEVEPPATNHAHDMIPVQ